MLYLYQPEVKRMSEKPKKQFKSESVNDLFRSSPNPLNQAKKEDTKLTQTTQVHKSKVKLVSKKNIRKLYNRSASTPTLSPALIPSETPKLLSPTVLPASSVKHLSNPSSASLLRSSSVNYEPPDSPISWSSPNAKISSFRRSLNATHSPYTRASESSLFFSEKSSPLQTKLNSSFDDQFWFSSPIWNFDSPSQQKEKRQSSTKSESVLQNWSSFSLDQLNIGEPLFNPTTPTSSESSTRNFSRFFPSPSIPQTNQFESIDPISVPVSADLDLPRPKELVTRTINTESYLKKTNPQFDYDNNTIPISLPSTSKSNLNHEHYTIKRDIELPHYPEGFSSTFHRRGINNFMFIRELQPKIMTVKNSDKVEIKVILPIQNSHGLIELNSQTVEMDKREFEGRSKAHKDRTGKHANFLKRPFNSKVYKKRNFS